MIKYAIWDQTKKISDRFLRQYIDDTHFELILDFIITDISDDPDILLKNNLGCDHLVIFSSGHITKNINLKPALERFCEYDFLIAGHPPMFIVNMKKYHEIGCPSYETLTHNDLLEQEMAMTLYLDATSLFSECLQQLSHDDLKTIPQGLTDDQMEYLKRLSKPGRFCRTFLFNTEKLIEEPAKPKRIFGLASGFKLFVLWHHFGQPSEVVYYDHNRASLRIWNDIVLEWSGRDFVSFCQSKGYYDDFSRMQSVIDLFGSEDALQQAWQRFQATRPKFIQCDIIRDPMPLMTNMAPTDNYIWYSNVFKYFESIRCYGLAGTAAKELKFLNTIRQRWPDTGFAGATF